MLLHFDKAGANKLHRVRNVYDMIELELEYLSPLQLGRGERKAIAGQSLRFLKRKMKEPRVAGLRDLRGQFLRLRRRNEQQAYSCGGATSLLTGSPLTAFHP